MDQQAAHSPVCSPMASAQTGQRGGNTRSTSGARDSRRKAACDTRAKLDCLRGAGKSGSVGVMEPSPVPRIFSPERRRARWQRAVARQQHGKAADFLFETLLEEIEDRLGFIRHEARTGLLIGDPSGTGADLLRARIPELSLASPATLDEEAVLPGQYDLLASLGLLDTVNDVPGALLHVRRALAPGGLAIIGMTGAGSLPRLRQALLEAEPDRTAARMHPMIDIRAAAALMQRAGFARQVADHFPLKVRYGSLERLIADLRDQGLTNALASAPPPLTRASLARARESFMAQADPDGKVTETFELIVLTGWG